MKLNDKDRLELMLYHADRILPIYENVSFDEFINSVTLCDTAVLNIGHIGEQVSKISDDFKCQHPEIPWVQLSAIRNRFFHDYMGINFKMLYKIITSDLPTLRKQLAQLQQKLTTKG